MFLIAVLAGMLMSPVTAYTEKNDTVSFEIAKKHFIRGVTFYNNMQYLAAADFFRKAVKDYPHYYTAREYLARAYKLAGFTTAAMDEWTYLHHVSPGNVSVLSKIDALQFRSAGEKITKKYSDLIHVRSYEARNYNRFSFVKPVDMAVDEEKNLYITSFESGRLVVLDTNGKGLVTTKPAMGGRIYGVDYHKGRLVVSDFSGDRILFLNTKGEQQSRFGSSGSDEGQFHGPEGVCFDSAGNIFVVDSGNNRVQKFNADGSFVLSFGKRGSYEGEFNNPTDVVVLDNTVYVTDTNNKRVVVFDTYGNYINSILGDELEVPRGITADKKNIIVSDEKKGILYYGIEDRKKYWFSSWDRNRKKFSRLVAAAIDRDGYLYCLDHNRNAMQLFAPVQNIYSNLEVDITAVDTHQFPVIAYYLHIRNREGNPVYGLSPSNFTIVEDNALITNHSVSYLKDKPRSASFVLAVDRSHKNGGYHNELAWVADFVLKKMHKNDSLKVVNFNNRVWTGNDFDWSRRRAIKAIQKRDYGKGKSFDKVLYQSIGDLVPRLNRRGIVMITDGSLREDSFSVYRPDIIVNYAREHFIPIYIMTFQKPDQTLVDIARKTGGQCFKAGKIDSLRKIYDNIRDAEEYRYVLVYSSHKNGTLKDYWADVKIEIDQKGQKGVEWGGYFVP